MGVVKINEKNLKKLSKKELKKLRSSNHISDELRFLIDEILFKKLPREERKYLYDKERMNDVQKV